MRAVRPLPTSRTTRHEFHVTKRCSALQIQFWLHTPDLYHARPPGRIVGSSKLSEAVTVPYKSNRQQQPRTREARGRAAGQRILCSGHQLRSKVSDGVPENLTENRIWTSRCKETAHSRTHRKGAAWPRSPTSSWRTGCSCRNIPTGRWTGGLGQNLAKPIKEARVAIVTTAALRTPDQPAFDTSIKGGDWSYRVLDANVDLRALRIAHRSDAFDVRGLEADKNLALPLDRLKSLAREGVIGEVAPRHFSFMGSIAAPGRLIAQTAPGSGSRAPGRCGGCRAANAGLTDVPSAGRTDSEHHRKDRHPDGIGFGAPRGHRTRRSAACPLCRLSPGLPSRGRTRCGDPRPGWFWRC